MEFRPFGATGLTVSRVGLGLAALGRPAYIDVGRDEDLGGDRSVEAMRDRAFEVLGAAYELGVRYVDVARSYGEAERFLAEWLDAAGHRDVVVGSKWGYTYTAGWRIAAEAHEIKDHSVGAFRRQLDETRSVLGDLLRVFQIHSVTLESGVLEDAEVWAALAELRASGVVVGFSVSGPRQPEAIRRALGIEVDGRPLFGSVQATWNALERSAGAALAEAHEAGLGVIVKEAMANGRLGPRGDASEVVRPIADRYGVGVDAAAIALVLAQPWADVVLSGAATASQLRSNVDALDLAARPDGDVPALAGVAGVVEDPEAYWSARAELRWS
jgi:aryl-alcohol dehydrogenase-like predicted oxidoreductase